MTQKMTFGIDAHGFGPHQRAFIIGFFAIFIYWIKEVLEFILHAVYGVNMIVVVTSDSPQRRIDTTYLSRIHQRGDIFYSAFHLIISICVGLIFYVMALYTPFPAPGSESG